MAREVSYPERGTPQGGVISPMLSNIYLHDVLDKWFEAEVKPRLKGKAFLIRFAEACTSKSFWTVYRVCRKTFECPSR